VAFPFVLNMNDFLDGYDGIKNKLDETVPPDFWTKKTRNLPKKRKPTYTNYKYNARAKTKKPKVKKSKRSKGTKS